jgi:hypothetical protein
MMQAEGVEGEEGSEKKRSDMVEVGMVEKDK